MKIQTVNQARARMLQIYSQVLTRVEGRRCVIEALTKLEFPTPSVQVVAVGKAASSMMQGAWEYLGDRINSALVITKYGHAGTLAPAIRVIEAGHPVTDSQSLLAGEALVEFVKSCDENSSLLFLISGGASALAEVLPQGISLQAYEKINRWLLSHPLTIHQVNHVRKAISMIKGGKLVQHLRTPNCWQLTLSDVPGNNLSVIGSGLLVHQTNPQIDIDLPKWLAALIPAYAPLEAADLDKFRQIHHLILADHQMACNLVKDIAKHFDLAVTIQGQMQGEAAEFGRAMGRFMAKAEKGSYIWCGETVMKLPESPGMGGRCQHLALAAAMELAGQEHVVVLAAGTDGSDGPGDVAGAMVDGQTLARGEDAGLDAVRCLQQADSGRFLQASGDLLDTGPTGTNVNDLVLAYKW